MTISKSLIIRVFENCLFFFGYVFLNIAICFFFSINLFCVFCWSETKSHCFHSLYVCRYIGFYLININNNRINTEYTSLSGYFFSIVLFFKKKIFKMFLQDFINMIMFSFVGIFSIDFLYHTPIYSWIV